MGICSFAIPVQWAGFFDPQTGIEDFWWCVGTAPKQCNVTSFARTLLSRTLLGTGLMLPVATPLYFTVRARNLAGLDTLTTSGSFIGTCCALFTEFIKTVCHKYHPYYHRHNFKEKLFAKVLFRWHTFPTTGKQYAIIFSNVHKMRKY